MSLNGDPRHHTCNSDASDSLGNNSGHNLRQAFHFKLSLNANQNPKVACLWASNLRAAGHLKDPRSRRCLLFFQAWNPVDVLCYNYKYKYDMLLLFVKDTMVGEIIKCFLLKLHMATQHNAQLLMTRNFFFQHFFHFSTVRSVCCTIYSVKMILSVELWS